ncbi:predicted protein [Phaeodactylum tricornutum CCAP 1055/1]|jgi:hypothetical protein|uniref:Uncharacterized protein n=2 Tax=Phaeodactylum tricornutum TaxID=2850 RepID=B7FXS6_PHATC|nr:predicted protein [Phaeodactylum tricornutum CCAP 1055/1]XP_002185189.1 predicted protein [Phaeodactylum tricornutum CCAP 1055/1]EEC43321.1 predicted protein [Phaeodactylum tricornutum CCAP 1055/1]EEC48596.1 predicted protein [Phaeodactylum tricornutum CCAP 1055/1]|eukprot:XP_002179610.1 predicted protein [Phaeodactylum tricornutum CCAP 1055/1]
MKFTAACALTLGLLVTQVMADPDPMRTDVELELSCKNVKFDRLTLEEQEFSAKILQDTYDAIHLIADNGDQELGNVHFDHPVMNGRSVKADGDTEEWVQRWSSINGAYFGGWVCRFCYDPDDFDETLSAESNKMLGSRKTQKEWEKAVTKALKDGPFTTFSRADKCSIDMRAANDLAETVVQLKVTEEDDPEPSETDIEIDVGCKGLDFRKFDLPMAAFSSRALQESFNEVHQLADDDDNMLDHIHFGGALDSTLETNALRRRKPFRRHTNRWSSVNGAYFGGWICRFCYDPDDFDETLEGMVSTSMIEKKNRKKKKRDSSDMHKAWEDRFLAKLLDHPKQVFKSARKCSIDFSDNSDWAYASSQ